jgi:hypothetical protein
MSHKVSRVPWILHMIGSLWFCKVRSSSCFSCYISAFLHFFLAGEIPLTNGVFLKFVDNTESRLAGDRTRKCSGQAGFKGRAPLFLVSTQNLNPSSWRIWHTNNCWKGIRNEKVTAPQSKKQVKNSKKQTTEHYKGRFPNTQKILCVLLCCC